MHEFSQKFKFKKVFTFVTLSNTKELFLWVFPYIRCVWYHHLRVCRVRSINQTINRLHNVYYVYHFGRSLITESIRARFWILQLMTMDVCPWITTVYIHQKDSLPSFWYLFSIKHPPHSPIYPSSPQVDSSIVPSMSALHVT